MKYYLDWNIIQDDYISTKKIIDDHTVRQNSDLTYIKF